MKSKNNLRLYGALAGSLIAGLSASAVQAGPLIAWETVVNNGDTAPDAPDGVTFFSYNQPSVNSGGLVVFRARARTDGGGGGGGGGAPVRGIYVRDMSASGTPILRIADTSTLVPDPNNTSAQFTEFPAFPRIDKDAATIAFRGQSTPVYSYTPLGSPTETRVGTSGIYTNPTGPLLTGASLLGLVPGFEYFSVPGTADPTRFDQFPGAPAVSDGKFVAFKGNYTEGSVGKTGVFFRDSTIATAPVVRIATSDTPIPGGGVNFGSTAPPSAANGKVVFAGFDNELAPTKGGIYLAPLADTPALTTLVGIGSAVPTVANASFNRFGEALSFDGRRVGFWGAWGDETRAITLSCPADGNAAVIAACNAQHPGGTFDTTVPLHQGIFTVDIDTQEVRMVAQTGVDGITDLVYWTFSGRPPGNGDGDEGDDAEPPRWRSSSFVAVDGDNVAFKATKTDVVGIYGQFDDGAPITTVLDTTMLGDLLDPESPDAALIVTLGIERDGLRGGYLTLNASMLDELSGESWAGIYLARVDVPEPMTLVLLAGGVGLLGATRRHRKTNS